MMFRTLVVTVGVFIILQSVCRAAGSGAEFTQRDFAHLIVKLFAWDAGLSQDRSDRDYLLILGGRRTYRYEAENAYNETTDRVTMREFEMFGPFTGKGWIFGVSDTTYTNFTVLMPIQGVYTLKAVLKGNGFVWNVDTREYRADSKSSAFREVEIGKVSLKAGVTKIKVTIPPEGAIDSFSFEAPDHAPIQPLVGWRFKERLTAGNMAEIAVSMTSRYAQLPASPDAPPPVLPVSEIAVIPANASKTTVAYMGKFTSREWVRADYRGAVLQIPLKVAATGMYGITATIMGERIRGSVNENRFEISAKPYLDTAYLGLFRLESGDNTITLELPPMGGIDTVTLDKKSTSADDFITLAGVKGPAGRPVTADEALSFLKSIQASFPVRK